MKEQGGLTTRFTYSPSGQLATIQFSDGKKATFEYGTNGLRKLLHYADGREVKYSYDAAGNLVATAVFDSKGKQVNGQTFVLDDSYAITKRTLFGGKTYVFEYDRNGNLTTMTEDGAVTCFTYDALDRLIVIKTPDGESYTYSYQPGEHSIIDEYAHASMTPSERIMGGISFNSLFDTYATRQQNSGYGAVRFSESLGVFEFPDEHHNDVVTPDLRLHQALLGMQLLSETGVTPLAKRQDEFTAPVNKLYMPAEFATINCCPECFRGEDGWTCPPCDPPPPPPDPPVISGPNTVWWFNGQTVSGYATSITLTASAGGATVAWSFYAGSDKVSLTPNGNQATVTSTGTAWSSASGDIRITASAGGQTSDQFAVTALRPRKLVAGTITDSCNSTFGYESQVNYTIQDNLQHSLSASVPLNEQWTTSVVPDYSGTDWRRGDEGSVTTDVGNPAAFFDRIQGETSSHTPTAVCDNSSTVAVQHWGQSWRVGSTSIGSGALVQTDAIQKYANRGRHTNITSPAD